MILGRRFACMTNETRLFAPVPAVSKSEMKICPTCRNAMPLLLVRGVRGRRYQCLDCSSEDPLQSPDLRKLLQNVQPPT
jgi:hypothetical protein